MHWLMHVGFLRYSKFVCIWIANQIVFFLSKHQAATNVCVVVSYINPGQPCIINCSQP